jgi:hypothetical protein
MKKHMTLICLILLMSGWVTQAQDDKPDPANGKQAAAASSQVYACDKCHMQSKVAGKCPMCGDEMKACHMMTDKDGKKVVCTCPADCTCTVNEADKARCTCGKPVKEVRLMDKKTGQDTTTTTKP